MFISFRGWSIIEEKLSTSDFVDLDSIIENFSKLRPKRFTSDSKYEEIMFSLCKKGQLNLLRPLLEELEDKNLQDEDKYTLLHCAAEHDQFHILEYLVQLWYKTNPKEFIIELFAPHVNGSEFQKNLFHLCEKGLLAWLKPLLEDLEDKNPGDQDKYTLMHCASEHGQLNILEYLLPLVKDKNPKDSKAMTPLKLATQKEDLPTIELFAPHVNSVDCLDTLFFLCKKGHLDTLKSLLQDSDDRNLQDEDMYSIMHCASEHGQFKILEYLAQLWHKNIPKILVSFFKEKKTSYES